MKIKYLFLLLIYCIVLYNCDEESENQVIDNTSIGLIDTWYTDNSGSYCESVGLTIIGKDIYFTFNDNNTFELIINNTIIDPSKCNYYMRFIGTFTYDDNSIQYFCTNYEMNTTDQRCYEIKDFKPYNFDITGDIVEKEYTITDNILITSVAITTNFGYISKACALVYNDYIFCRAD